MMLCLECGGDVSQVQGAPGFWLCLPCATVWSPCDYAADCDSDEYEDAELAADLDYLAAQGRIITDDCGNYWSARCPTCEQMTMRVMRPGKVQCPHCTVDPETGYVVSHAEDT